MDESEKKSLAQDVAEIVKLSKISDIWKDPKKAQSWGIGGWMAAYIFGIIAVACIAYTVTVEPMNDTIENNWMEFKNIAVANMDCDTLKQTLLDLEASPTKFNTSLDLEKQIIARC